MRNKREIAHLPYKTRL